MNDTDAASRPPEARPPGTQPGHEEPFERESYRRTMARWLYTLLYLPVFFTFLLLFGYQCFHRRRLLRRRGVLVLANHQAHLDPLVTGLATTVPLHFMARAALFRIPVFRRLIRILGAFPVYRGRRDTRALDFAAELLRSGHNVLIFGEGTRSWDWEILEIRGGIEVIARKARGPIVPLIIDGAGQTNPRGKGPLAVDPQRIAVWLAEPIPPEVYEGWPEHTMPAHLRPILVENLERLRPHTYGPTRRSGQVAMARVAVRLLMIYIYAWRELVRLIVHAGRRKSRTE